MTMGNPQYEKGVRLERKVQVDLAEHGWLTIRAAGSKGDTKADLVAFHPDGRMLLIQVKYSKAITTPEWNRIYQVAGWCHATAIVASNGPKGRGVTYEEITGARVPRSRNWPSRVYDVTTSATIQKGAIPCLTSSVSGS